MSHYFEQGKHASSLVRTTFRTFEKQNAVVGDTSAATPGGVRIGTAAITSRSMGTEHMETIADFLHRAVQISLTLQKEAGSKKLVDFTRVATEGNGEGRKELEALSEEVLKFATSFPLPGVPVSFYHAL